MPLLHTLHTLLSNTIATLLPRTLYMYTLHIPRSTGGQLLRRQSPGLAGRRLAAQVPQEGGEWQEALGPGPIQGVVLCCGLCCGSGSTL